MYLPRRLLPSFSSVCGRSHLPGAAALVVGAGRLQPTTQYSSSANESTFLLLYEYVEDMTVRRTSYRAAHLALAQFHKEQGKVVMGGAFADAAGAAYVFKVPRREDVEEFVRADPYFEHGLVSHYSIKEWHLTS